jgi:murein DD-endopeptidase MepM/ murein hydrolase activator NlpD
MARYFVHLPSDGSPAIFWRRLAGFARQLIHINLNLLAHAVGDDPAALLPAGGKLVPPQDYVRFTADTSGGSTVIPALQPFAFTPKGGSSDQPQALPIAGTNLERFLDDPLRGERMDLSLPFYDEDIKLGTNGGGWFRNSNNNEKDFHGGTDFNTSPAAAFDVCAAADGSVLAMAGDCLVLSHTTANGRQFQTIYQHMNLSTTPHKEKAPVRRGEFLGRTDSTQRTVHLHFGAAVQVSDGLVSLNGVQIDEFWYFIDPWGVYDLRANHYLPTTGRIFESSIMGATHAIQWRAQPLFKTIPIARSTDGYKKIIRVQVRARRGDNLGGTFPPEQEQFLVWLEGDPDFFLVPLNQASNLTTELELVALLREAFSHGKGVQLEYRYAGDLRYIMAAWVNA